MPVVFVHGVNVRDGAEYKKRAAARTALFRRILLPGLSDRRYSTPILNPYWGGSAAKFRWNHASLHGPDEDEALGAEDALEFVVGATVGEAGAESAAPLRHTAGRSLQDAVDLLWAVAADDVAGDAEAANELARLGELVNAYVESHTSPAWLDSVQSDPELVARLIEEVEKFTPPSTPVATADDEGDDEELGGFDTVWDRIRESADRVTSIGSRLSGRAAVAVGRGWAHRKSGRFLGDVFAYLAERRTPKAPGPILTDVLADLRKAAAKATETDPLIVIAHSMGGNIMYDVLTHFLPSLHVKEFVTVGSQVALFQELDLFANKLASGYPADPKVDRMPKPANVGRWLNVYDVNDVLGYPASGVFEAIDYSYSTGKGAVAAHSAYFDMPSFHRRLRARLLVTE